MAPLPQKPKTSHAKKISVVTSRSVETGDVKNMRPAGRRKREMRKFASGRSTGVELDPRPSDDVDDPLVSSLSLPHVLKPSEEQDSLSVRVQASTDDFNRIGQDGKKKPHTDRWY